MKKKEGFYSSLIFFAKSTRPLMLGLSSDFKEDLNMFKKNKDRSWYVIGAIIGAIGGLLVLWKTGKLK